MSIIFEELENNKRTSLTSYRGGALDVIPGWTLSAINRTIRTLLRDGLGLSTTPKPSLIF